jgi:hypothetical protein
MAKKMVFEEGTTFKAEVYSYRLVGLFDERRGLWEVECTPLDNNSKRAKKQTIRMGEEWLERIVARTASEPTSNPVVEQDFTGIRAPMARKTCASCTSRTC